MKCTKCELHKEASRVVLGEGDSDADIMIVGEAPGYEEDKRGRPFVGKAGKILDEVLDEADLERDEVYITNVCKCRPPDNREPERTEVKACLPFLQKEIELVSPKVIVALGNSALKVLTGRAGITKARGICVRSPLLEGSSVEILPTFHPAAMLHGKGDYRTYIVRDMKKAVEIAEGGVPAKTISTDYRLLKSNKEVKAFVRKLKTVEAFTYDLETTGLNPRAEDADILMIGISVGTGYGVCIPMNHPESPLNGSRRNERLVQEALSLGALKIAHNAKYDIQYLEEQGYTVADPIYDTMLAHYVIDETKRTHGLKMLSWDYTDMGGYDRGLGEWFEANGMKSANSKRFERVPLDLLSKYCCGDVDATFRLYERFDEEHTDAQRWLLDELLHPALRVLVAAERYGFGIDLSYMDRLDASLIARITEIDTEMRRLKASAIAKAEKKLWNVKNTKRMAKLVNPDKAKPTAPVRLNFKSPEQLALLLFKVMRLPREVADKKTKRTAKKKTDTPSVDEEAINYAIDHSKKEANMDFLELLLDWRKLDVLYRTFVKGLREKIDLDGRLHGEFWLTGTETGRLSSSNPNMQNIPRTPLIKNEFCSKDRHVIMQADFSQVELRVAAIMSKDIRMAEVFESGGDMHRETAAVVYAVEPEEVTKEQRNLAKKVNFGIVYGRGAQAIADETGVPVEEAQDFIDEYYRVYSGLKKWIKGQHDYARKRGYVVTPFGRKRRLPDASSSEFKKRNEAYRQSVNTPIQSAASDLCVFSMIKIHEWLTLEEDEIGGIMGNVHDSIILEVHEDAVDKVAVKVKWIMETLRFDWLTLPIVADIEVGKRWGRLKEWQPTK